MSQEEIPEWVAEVHHDWTTLQILKLGIAFAFNRETGRVYKLPSNECPFIQNPWHDHGKQLSRKYSDAEVEKLRDAANVALGWLTGGMDGDWREFNPTDLLREALRK